MDPLHYTVVFSVADAGYKAWWFPAVGVGMILAGIFLIPLFNLMSSRPWSPGALGLFQICWVGFGILWTIGTFFSTFVDYWSARSALKDGSAACVAGTVEQFVPDRGRPHSYEEFEVGGVYFHYSESVISAGFNTPAAHGGPMHAGLPVHIWYVNKGGSAGNEILKLEVAEK